MGAQNKRPTASSLKSWRPVDLGMTTQWPIDQAKPPLLEVLPPTPVPVPVPELVVPTPEPVP